jgi:hypothetical protein
VEGQLKLIAILLVVLVLAPLSLIHNREPDIDIQLLRDFFRALFS